MLRMPFHTFQASLDLEAPTEEFGDCKCISRSIAARPLFQLEGLPKYPHYVMYNVLAAKKQQ